MTKTWGIIYKRGRRRSDETVWAESVAFTDRWVHFFNNELDKASMPAVSINADVVETITRRDVRS